ncbi:MAG: DUF5615 family PIN-like protein [Actinomycetota bacterium]
MSTGCLRAGNCCWHAVSTTTADSLKGGAAAARPAAPLADEDVFRFAQSDRRAVVTEDIADYRPLALNWEAAESPHYGIIFTTNRKWPRARPETVGRLITALDDLLNR